MRDYYSSGRPSTTTGGRTGLFATRERAGWDDDVAALQAALAALPPARLDVACGTGFSRGTCPRARPASTRARHARVAAARIPRATSCRATRWTRCSARRLEPCMRRTSTGTCWRSTRPVPRRGAAARGRARDRRLRAAPAAGQRTGRSASSTTARATASTSAGSRPGGLAAEPAAGSRARRAVVRGRAPSAPDPAVRNERPASRWPRREALRQRLAAAQRARHPLRHRRAVLEAVAGAAADDPRALGPGWRAAKKLRVRRQLVAAAAALLERRVRERREALAQVRARRRARVAPAAGSSASGSSGGPSMSGAAFTPRPSKSPVPYIARS